MNFMWYITIPGFLSGWTFKAFLRYAVFITCIVASGETSKRPYKSSLVISIFDIFGLLVDVNFTYESITMVTRVAKIPFCLTHQSSFYKGGLGNGRMAFLDLVTYP